MSQDPPVLPQELVSGQPTKIWAIGMFCIFCWEWLVCLPTEIKRIWKQKFTSISALYLANRYFGLLQSSVVISLVSGAWKSTTCEQGFLWVSVGILISIVLSQLILGVRVYAVFGLNRPIGILFSVILFVQVGIGAYSIRIMNTPRADPRLGIPIICHGAISGPLSWLIPTWSIPLLFDTLAFILTTWKTYQLWSREATTPLLSVIWRDGVLYFFAIFSMNFANVAILLLRPDSLRGVNINPTVMLTIILSCRLVLNIRTTFARDDSRRIAPHGVPNDNKLVL